MTTAKPNTKRRRRKPVPAENRARHYVARGQTSREARLARSRERAALKHVADREWAREQVAAELECDISEVF